MIALVADGERGMRTVVRRVLQQLDVEAYEAENGLEVLLMLEDGKADADLIVIDVDMPILNGVETLRAIRSSEKYRDIPVVCMSSAGDDAAIRELIAIGISDFLLKPMRPDVVTPRFQAVLRGADRWRQRASARATSEVLFVETDPNFLAFARPLLAAHFDVVEAASAPKAAALFQERSPAPRVVLVPEGLPLLDEVQMVETLRRIAARLKTEPPEVYLIAQSDALDPAKARRFDGVLRKTFVPEQFAAALQRVVLKVVPLPERLASLLDGELMPEVLSATQQTIGVLMGRDLVPLPAEEAAALALPMRSTLVLGAEASEARLEISLLADRASVLGLAAKMLGCELSIEEGAADVLDELANTLAGRVRASLLLRDIDLTMGLPAGAVDDPAQTAMAWSHVAAFRSAAGEQMLVGLRVRTPPGAP